MKDVLCNISVCTFCECYGNGPIHQPTIFDLYINAVVSMNEQKNIYAVVKLTVLYMATLHVQFRPFFSGPFQNPKSRSREIGRLNCRNALKLDRHIDSSAVEVPVKFQSDRTILNKMSRLRDFTSMSRPDD